MALLGSTERCRRVRTVNITFGGTVRRCNAAPKAGCGEHSGRDDMSEQTRSVMAARGAEGFDADWASRGACRTSDPDALFVQGAEQNRAKQVCMSCVVRTE